jgi:hypothetical protein
LLRWKGTLVTVIKELTADDSLTPRQRIKVRSIRRIGAKILMENTPPIS